MARWCQLTRSDFCFYAKAEPYAPLSSLPIKRIPLTQILEARRVKYAVPTSKGTKDFESSQLEIFLHPKKKE